MEYNEPISILISETAPKYIKDFISDFVDNDNVIFINPNEAYMVSNLIVSEFYNINFQSSILNNVDVYKMIIEKYKDDTLIRQNKKYVYISRRDSVSNKNRQLINELELENLLNSKYKIPAINLVDLTFKEKVQLFMYNNIIGFSGAGMINIIFSCNNNKVYMINHPIFKCLYFWEKIAKQFGCQLLNLMYYTYLEKNSQNKGKCDNLPYYCNIQKLDSFLHSKNIYN